MSRGERSLAVVAPTRESARAAAARLARRAPEAVEPFSLAAYLATPRASPRIVICPDGPSVASEIAFLADVAERALWPPPDRILADAIQGLLGSPDSVPARRTRASRPRSVAGEDIPTTAAVLLEGTVTSARARALAPQGARQWIVESPRRVRVERSLMARLRRIGVRWFALEPVRVVAVFASSRLARARSRWRRLVPPGTSVWVRGR
jgi:hypothetical protein